MESISVFIHTFIILLVGLLILCSLLLIFVLHCHNLMKTKQAEVLQQADEHIAELTRMAKELDDSDAISQRNLQKYNKPLIEQNIDKFIKTFNSMDAETQTKIEKQLEDFLIKAMKEEAMASVLTDDFLWTVKLQCPKYWQRLKARITATEPQTLTTDMYIDFDNE